MDRLDQDGQRHQHGFADYVGLIPDAGTFTDNANGTSHISFFRVP